MKALHNHNNATEEAEQWTASSSSSSLAITDLPSHILMDILSRLPIKTLLASKCVCKSWLHLIIDPYFSKLHHARAKVELFLQNFSKEKTSSHSLGLLQLPKFVIDPKLFVNNEPLEFINSCNGLICYKYYKFIVIWNPITSEYMTVPTPKTYNGLSKIYAYGFGFSQKANRFKLLRVMGQEGEDPSDEKIGVAEICTIEKGSSWRTVGPLRGDIWKLLPYPLFHPSIGTFFQGALHWLGVDHTSKCTALVSFNFDDEMLGKVPLPAQFQNDNYFSGLVHQMFNRVGVLAGSLFVTHITKQGVNIWLMKEYGVPDSWTQVCSSPFTPITYMDNGEMVLMSRGSSEKACLFLYNSVTNSTRFIGYGPAPIRLIAFSPSLVRLKDSMMEYDDVHVTPRSAALKHREMATSPSWWNWKSKLYKTMKQNSKTIQRSVKRNKLFCIFLGGLLVLFFKSH